MISKKAERNARFIEPENSRRQARAPGFWKITAIEEILVHLQIFVLDAAVDPDNLGERKIQTSAPNPHISVLLLNFCARKGAAFIAHSQEYQAQATLTSKSNLMGKKLFNPMLTRSSTPMGNRLTHT